jgi:hypothetical protein
MVLAPADAAHWPGALDLIDGRIFLQMVYHSIREHV